MQGGFAREEGGKGIGARGRTGADTEVGEFVFGKLQVVLDCSGEHEVAKMPEERDTQKPECKRPY